jgi:hypothetical protein
MRLNAKVGIATAIGALAVTGPAVAEACTHGQHGQQQQGQQGQIRPAAGHAQFSRFGRRGRRFGHSEFGTLVSWSATQTGTHTYSGTITVSKPAFTGHHSTTGSSSLTTQQVTYTFTNARVFFGQGANPPAAGDLVKVIGARLNHCTSTSSSTSTSTGNVRAILIAAPRSSTSS